MCLCYILFTVVPLTVHACVRTVPLPQVLLLRLGSPSSFLAQCLEPPSKELVRSAIAVLMEIKAVLPLAELPLTALGYHLARMPVDVRVGKMLVYAALLQVWLLLATLMLSCCCTSCCCTVLL
jgi:HrpA-like RNA helicase